MAKAKKSIRAIADEIIINKIYFIRGQKVMLDRDLAEMYNVSTGNLNKAVKRNLKRFPEDFMFQVTKEEFKNLIFQNGTSSWGGTRKMPYAFTEQGVSMLSSVLNSDTAIEVNIRIIRIFAKLRKMLLTHKDILLKLEQMEKQMIENSGDIQNIFAALRELLNPPQEPRPIIGFKLQGKKKK
ncbi:MAG: ORF6N domain-containing protein [Chitinophagaceae bacterium]|nr:ORF6N domain-containing protein [Chitinophagaceae bacterium]